MLLKSRPTVAQLTDRLLPPIPEGIELYLAADDIQGESWLDDAIDRVHGFDLPRDFDLRVESPVRALGGKFFDITSDSPENRETLNRVVRFGGAIGASSACVHLIAPTSSMRIGARDREDALASSRALLRHYARVCAEHGLTPTIENVPPIGQMREGTTMTSPIGVWSEDLLICIEAVPSLRITFDTSHAGMACNFMTLSETEIAGEYREPRRAFREVADASVRVMLDRLGDAVLVAHVSGVRGYRGEGLPYACDDPDLDEHVDWLLRHCDALVAEILEPDPATSQSMRSSAARIVSRREHFVRT
ncbi:MAG: hypothetical protein EPO26_09365 [Chloroflexota bacterium]|nr:MAG: hypothetical protein EPO26_09365 [Chloroflexota bacterium]